MLFLHRARSHWIRARGSHSATEVMGGADPRPLVRQLEDLETRSPDVVSSDPHPELVDQLERVEDRLHALN